MNNSLHSKPSFPDSKLLPESPANTLYLRNFCTAAVLVLVAFSVPLYHLVRFALESPLYSHVILVPFISAYLVWTRRSTLPPSSRPDRRLAVLPFTVGLALLVFRLTSDLQEEDALSATMLSLALILIGLCAWSFGRSTLRAISFPLCFLLFMAPFPVAVTNWIEITLQNWSASAAHVFFQLGGTPVYRDATFFQLPGMRLVVAQECSSVHSTLALFLTSLVAGYIFLSTPGKRAVLALAVVPLAVLRNGFRVFVIGELCVHIGPEMIDSYIHRHGGPIFFALTLIPFFSILWLLMRTDRPQPAVNNPVD